MNQKQRKRYRKLLLLSYFKSNYKKYEYSEAVKILGITFDELNSLISSLIKSGLLIKRNDYLVVSKSGERLLSDECMARFFDENINEGQATKWDIEKPYIPINFHM